MCVSLSLALGALTDGWEIDVIARRTEGRKEGTEGRRARFLDGGRCAIDRIDLFASGISSRVRAFARSRIHSFVHSFLSTRVIHHGGGFGQRGTEDADEAIGEEVSLRTRRRGRITGTMGRRSDARRFISRSVVGYWTRVARRP